jgi:hypothetical protein
VISSVLSAEKRGRRNFGYNPTWHSVRSLVCPSAGWVKTAAEAVPPNAREVRGGACCLQREVRVEGIGGGNVGKGREITGSGREKGRGVAIVSGAAVIGDWSNRIKTVTRSEYSADIGGQRGPTEVGVKLVNSVELRLGATAFEDLFQCQMDEVPESVAVS